MAPATATIEQEVTDALTKVLGAPFAPKEGEARNKYLARMARTADKKVTDDIWAGLSDEAQNWVNTANKAINDTKPVVEPDEQASADTDEEDLDSDDDDEDEDDDASDDASASAEDEDDDASDDDSDDDDDDDKAEPETAGKKEPKVKKTKAKKEPKAKKEKKAKAPKEGGRVRATDKGAADDFCRLVIKHPDDKLEALMERFNKSGAKIHQARAASVRRSTLRVLRCQAK